MSQRLTVALNGKENEDYSLLPEGMGYQYEAAEVMKCLDEGRLESDIVPHSFTLGPDEDTRQNKGSGWD